MKINAYLIRVLVWIVMVTNGYSKFKKPVLLYDYTYFKYELKYPHSIYLMFTYLKVNKVTRVFSIN